MNTSQQKTMETKKERRTFIKQSVMASAGMVVIPSMLQCSSKKASGLVLEPSKIDGLKIVDGEDYLDNSTWYAGENVNDGFHYQFPAGSLADKKFITTDMLADGNTMIKFNIELQEGAEGRIFQFAFGVLNHWKSVV